MRVVTPLLVVLAVLASAASAPRPAVAQQEAPVTLRPGDAVRISVWQRPEISGEFPVAADGSIASPFYMDVNVAGVPFEEVADRVRSYIAVFEAEPRVLVEPLLQVSIAGEVLEPGLYTLRPETTLAQAVMHAGGATERGHVTRVTVWRDGQELIADLTLPNAGLAAQRIRSGDQIVMPRQVSILRDYIAPAASVIGAAAAVTNIVLRRW